MPAALATVIPHVRRLERITPALPGRALKNLSPFKGASMTADQTRVRARTAGSFLGGKILRFAVVRNVRPPR